MLCSSILFSGNSCGVELVVAGFEGSQECQMLSKATWLNLLDVTAGNAQSLTC